jgi:hypothetical protein
MIGNSLNIVFLLFYMSLLYFIYNQVQLKIYNVYNFVLMKNDTIISAIICYDFYDNDNDVFLFFDDFKCVIFNVRV